MEQVFHGERTCARDGCPNRAYWSVGATYLCGVHSKKNAQERRPLAKDPDAKRKRGEALHTYLTQVMQRRTLAPTPGRISCYRLLMMRQVPLELPWLNVFPNNKHATRPDGLGFPALSPMQLGPVEHDEPGVPAARNIENYHQFAKVWPSEVEIAGAVIGGATPSSWPAPNKAWYVRRSDGYQDPVPHRHKFSKEQQEREVVEVAGANKNAPAYSARTGIDGTLQRFTYVESRYFYCVAYEDLARKTDAFATLLDLHRHGIDLRLCGYDAFDMGANATADELYDYYQRTDQPFGHERVLCALLKFSDTPEMLPWHRYRRDHPTCYAIAPGACSHLFVIEHTEPGAIQGLATYYVLQTTPHVLSHVRAVVTAQEAESSAGADLLGALRSGTPPPEDSMGEYETAAVCAAWRDLQPLRTRWQWKELPEEWTLEQALAHVQLLSPHGATYSKHQCYC